MRQIQPPIALREDECTQRTGLRERNSYIETYRILAVFSVLITHYNGWFLGGLPDSFDFGNPTAQRIGQVVIAAACACCVKLLFTYFWLFQYKSSYAVSGEVFGSIARNIYTFVLIRLLFKWKSDIIQRLDFQLQGIDAGRVFCTMLFYADDIVPYPKLVYRGF